jgi:hypothetical protein
MLVLVGCAASPEKLESVASTESARLMPPSKPLASFARFELQPMVLSPAVSREEGKVEQAKDLEKRLREIVQPMLDRWNAAPKSDESGTLLIEPQLASLKIVSGGARFWGGAFAGGSNIDLDLVMVVKETGQQIANPRIKIESDAFTGAWSIGASDQNLKDYIAHTAGQYLSDNYNR